MEGAVRLAARLISGLPGPSRALGRRREPRPDPIGVNPMLTVQALATRVAGHLAEALR